MAIKTPPKEKTSLEEYQTAISHLNKLVKMYAPGGTYGAGQYATIESEAKKAKAESLAGLVASGMSSGTTAAGLRARLGKDISTAKLGVEDVRTGKYGEALTGLAGLRAALAERKALTEERESEEFYRISAENRASTAANIAESNARLYKGTAWDPNRTPVVSGGGGTTTGGETTIGGGGGKGGIGGIGGQDYVYSLGGEGEHFADPTLGLSPLTPMTEAEMGKFGITSTPGYSDVYKGIVNEATGGYLGGLKTAAKKYPFNL
jgi:hypothetical protein